MGNQNGKYQQQNQSGKPKKNVHWKSAERPSPPGRPMLIPLSDQQPDVVSLRWERPKIDGGSPITGYVVEHRRMGSPHWVRATPTPVINCEVSISGLEPGWRYQFRAFAENIVGRSEPSELSDPLTVTLQRNAISVPRFVDELQDTQAVEDERIEFRVRILGQPQPEISWFKDGYEIFSSRRTKIVNDNDASVLIIHQVALTDEGEIRCTATNRAGHVVTKARLLVQAPPKIRLPRTYEDGMIVEADEMVRLKVGIAGQPMPVVTWLHEGEVVQNGGRFEIINTDKNSMLKIDNIQRENRGEYSIRASNRLGEDVSSFLVTVTARPNAPGKVRLNMSFGKSATLSWTAPVDDGGCKIGNYIVEYFRLGWNVWLKAATTRSLSTTLHDLIEGSEYKFRVKAENPYGLSDPSEESDVLFIPDPKRGITKPKSASKIAEPLKIAQPLPPRRKTLSPPRPQQQDAATDIAVAIKRVSPNLARKARPQLLDSEDLHNEMSYGTSVQGLKKDVQKSPSMSSADSTQPTAKPNLRLNIKPNVSPAISPPRSPTVETPLPKSSPKPLPMAAENNSLFSKSLLKPRLASPERSDTPETSTAPLLSRKRSKSPASPVEVTPTRKSITPEARRSTKGLERSTEPVQLENNQHVRRFSGSALSPAKDAPALAIAIALGNIGMANNISGIFHQNMPNAETANENGAGKVEHVDGDASVTDRQNSKVYGNGRSNPNERNGTKNNTESSKNNANGKRNETKSANGNGRTNNGNGNGNGRNNASTLTNPTIQISAPPPTSTANAPATERKSPTPPASPLSATDKHDDVHTSNEFMLVVFDKKSRVKDKDKQDSFELDLEDALQPPPISISSPDLASLEFTNLHSFPLRRSVSSTELLYERAMARFYEAVELEEAEKARKLKISQDRIAAPPNVQPATVRKRLGTMTEAERLSFERRSELRRQSADIGQDFKLPTKWSSRENISNMKSGQRANGKFIEPKRQESGETDDLSDLLQARSAPTQEESYELGSDYTESTASSDADSIEKFKMELMARTHSPSPRELDTYHPRNMGAGVFTPYRAPEPEQSAVALTRPLPLPSPDFVPKPILKRPSNENMVLETSPPPVSPSPVSPLIVSPTSISPLPVNLPPVNPPPVNPPPVSPPPVSPNPGGNEKSSDFAKGFKSFFKRDKKSVTEKNTEENETMAQNTKDQISAAEVETKRRTKEDEERKRLEAERIMLEEAKAAADHYSELMQQVSTTHKYHTPLYLDRDELKKATERLAKERGVRLDDNGTDMDNINSLQPPQMSTKPRLSISERGQMKHVRETASNLAFMQPKAQAKPIPDTPSESECEPSVSGFQQRKSTALSPPSPSPPTSPTTTSTVISETYVERPDSRGRTRLVKVKRIIKKRVPSSTGSREASSSRPPTNRAPIQNPAVTPADEAQMKRRLNSRTRSTVRGESKSPGPIPGRRQLKTTDDLSGLPVPASKLIVSLSNGQLLEVRSADQMSEEAHEKVRSALSYSTDLVLFVVACYVYLFKDARLVLPILALLIYRQLGEAINSIIPHWMKRKKD